MPHRAARVPSRQQARKPSQSLLTRDQGFGSVAGAVVDDDARANHSKVDRRLADRPELTNSPLGAAPYRWVSPTIV
jgi:hypothetical protein